MKLVTINDIAGGDWEDRLLAALLSNLAAEATAAEHARLWDELAATYLSAKSASDNYWNTVTIPALDACDGAKGGLDPIIEDEGNRLLGAQDEAEDLLFAFPSPHGRALALKCLVAMDHGRDVRSLRRAVLEDARQLYQRSRVADRQDDKLAAAWIDWRDAVRIQLSDIPDGPDTDAAEARVIAATDILYGAKAETLSGVLVKLRAAFVACDDTYEGQIAAVDSDEALIAYGRENGGDAGLIAGAIDFLLKMEAARA